MWPEASSPGIDSTGLHVGLCVYLRLVQSHYQEGNQYILIEQMSETHWGSFLVPPG